MSTSHLSRRDFLRVRELLAENLPPNDIATRVALPVETVNDIAAGRAKPSRIIVDRDDPQHEAVVNSQRCPGCGGMVYRWPCLGCQIAAQRLAPPQTHRISGERLKDKRRREARKRRRAA